jgi:hypothetical protein
VRHACRSDRSQVADGRHVVKWLLQDQRGAEHIAVEGIERDARDGHYVYAAQQPFASRVPLTRSSNKADIQAWLENFVTHHAPESAVHVGDHIDKVCPCRHAAPAPAVPVAGPPAACPREAGLVITA